MTIPLGTTAPVSRKTNAAGMTVFQAGTETEAGNFPLYSKSDGAGTSSFTNASATPTYSLDPNGGLEADLTAATGATINQLRLAFATQKFLEIQARGGSRYIEVIKNHFNVTSPDARLQRPEYLGGGSSPVNISPVAQTSSTDATNTAR